MKLRTLTCAAAVYAFSGCAILQEPARSCGLAAWNEESRRLKAISKGLYDDEPDVRLQSARRFSGTVGLIGCAEGELRAEMQRMNLAKYAILDASIAKLEDKDERVRLASVTVIRELILDMGLPMDKLSFRALLIGMKDESPRVRDGIAEVVSFVCSRQRGLCTIEPKKQTI